jgi:hypothetical protein
MKSCLLFIANVLLLYPLATTSAANLQPQIPIVRKPLPEPHLQPTLCSVRFWRNRFPTYCNTITAAQAIHSVAAQAPLNVFAVDRPVRLRDASSKNDCSMTLMEHTFGFSYGKPFVGNYTPPACKWTHVLFNLTMTSSGRQFDRLGLMFLGDTEVFRTSTAEPTSYGIVFSHVKDMTRYSALLRRPQKIIFDLENLVDDKYTGYFVASLTATFYTPTWSRFDPADTILPISAGQGRIGRPSHFHLPHSTAASKISFPKNTVKAIVSVSATGNAEEEFWYTNVPSSYVHTWASAGTTLYGYSPFREVRVLVDGGLAGVAWPFPVIYTGGVSPALWRPIVSIGAFDLPEYEVDITPFLPLLVDGAPHDIRILVVSYDEVTGGFVDHVGQDWLVSGRVFIWEGCDRDAIQLGYGPVRTDESQVRFRPVLAPDNSSLAVRYDISRKLSVSNSLRTVTGEVKNASWKQDLAYRSFMNITEQGSRQVVATNTADTDGTEYGGRKSVYPLYLSLRYDEGYINARIRQEVKREGREYFGGAESGNWLHTKLFGKADWKLDVGGMGNTTQVYAYRAERENSEVPGAYFRRVSAYNSSVVEDREVVSTRNLDARG